MFKAPETLGIIAGSRSLPFRVATQARAAGVKRLVVAAFEKETDPRLADLVDEIEWLRVGQLGRLCTAFTSRGVRHCVMAGQIAPSNLFDLRPDMRAMALLLRTREKNAHTLFAGIARELARDGVELISAVPLPDPVHERTRQRTVLTGELPSPVNPPSGCPFHTRCPLREDRCSREIPALRTIAPGHEVACHLVE